jgi:hypothetical protein
MSAAEAQEGFTLANKVLSQSGEMFGPARRTNKVL